MPTSVSDSDRRRLGSGSGYVSGLRTGRLGTGPVGWLIRRPVVCDGSSPVRHEWRLGGRPAGEREGGGGSHTLDPLYVTDRGRGGGRRGRGHGPGTGGGEVTDRRLGAAAGTDQQWRRHGGGGQAGQLAPPPPTSDRTPREIDGDPRRFSCPKKWG